MARGGLRTPTKVEPTRNTNVDRSNALLISGYKIYRFDRFNFALEKESNGVIEYYPTVYSALCALFHKKVDSGSLETQNLLNRIELAERSILDAIKHCQDNTLRDKGVCGEVAL